MRTVLALSAAAFILGCSDSTDSTTQNSFVPPQDLPSFFTCMDAAEKAVAAAHRGGPAAGYPENTIEAFQRMVDNGIWLLEIDVQTSADGVLFLFHDDDLDRLTAETGPVAEKTWAELRELTLKDENGQPTPYVMPRLDEALTWAKGKAILQLDIKKGTDYDDVALAVSSAEAGGRVIPIAYNRGQAMALRRRFPNSMISVPVPTEQEYEILIARGIASERILAWGGIDEIDQPHFEYLDSKNVEVAFGTLGGMNSMDNHIATKGDDSQYADIISEGVDVISTDRPIEARQALLQADRWPDAKICR